MDEEIKLMKFHYRKSRLYKKRIAPTCGRCGIELKKGSIVCRTALMGSILKGNMTRTPMKTPITILMIKPIMVLKLF